MNKQTSNKTWIWIAVVIFVVAIGYFYFSGSSAPASSTLLSSSGSESDATVAGAQVLALLNQIKSLKIDTSLFTDPGYQTLRDYSVAIPPVPVGRQNPFAPLPGFSTAPVTH